MATKTTTKSSFVTVSAGRGNPRYALKGNKLVSASTSRSRYATKRFAMRGEIAQVLYRLYRVNDPEYTVTFYTNNGATQGKQVATRRGDDLLIGCHRFDAKAVRKLSRWTGVAVS